jgi:hypothetical protein
MRVLFQNSDLKRHFFFFADFLAIFRAAFFVFFADFLERFDLPVTR